MEKEEMQQVVEQAGSEETQGNNKRIENMCRRVMVIVMPCIGLMIALLMIFNGSGEARGVKSALKKENCDVTLFTDSSEISEFLSELDLDLKNVEEVIFAIDKEDPEVYALVFFCESRMDAEDAEHAFAWLATAESYCVERNAKVACFGYSDLVDVVMKELD